LRYIHKKIQLEVIGKFRFKSRQYPDGAPAFFLILNC
jgi:hypothetical protein